MAKKLVTCKTCGSEIAKSAKVCPNCGAKNNQVGVAVRIVIALVAVLLLAMIVSSISGNGSKSERTDEGTSQNNTVVEQEQVFDSDLATIEYRDLVDAAGNAVVRFALTNKTDRLVYATTQNMVVNGQYDVAVLTQSGMLSMDGIQPGHTSVIAPTFGVSNQTALSGPSDIETLDGVFEILDAETNETLGTIPFSVVV